MMKIDRRTIEHLENLARIQLSEDEKDKLAVQLGNIIELVETLRTADTSEVDATSIMEHLDKEHLRPDERIPGLNQEDVLDRAPDIENGFFRVPRIIDRVENE